MDFKAHDYFLYRDGHQHGPISAGEFRLLVERRHLRGNDLVWFNGLAEWTKAEDIPGLLTPLIVEPLQPVAPIEAVDLPALQAPFATIEAAAGERPAEVHEPVEKVSGGAIFISYRRGDARHAAGRLVDRLAQTYRRDQLFLDTDSIEPGLDFVQILSEKVEACDVLLAIIGPDWLNARDINGDRRLENPTDFVRIEIEAALQRNVRVIPVLVDGARMPMATELPPSIARLSTRNAVRLEHERFGADAEGLIRALTRIVTPQTDAPAAVTAMGPVPTAVFAPVEAAPEVPAAPAAASIAVSKTVEVKTAAPENDATASEVGNDRFPWGDLVAWTVIGAATTVIGAYIYAWKLAGPTVQPLKFALLVAGILVVIARRHWSAMPWKRLIAWAVLAPAAAVIWSFGINNSNSPRILVLAIPSALLLAAWLRQKSSPFELGLVWAVWSSVMIAVMSQLHDLSSFDGQWDETGGYVGPFGKFQDLLLFQNPSSSHLFYLALFASLAVGIAMAVRWWHVQVKRRPQEINA